jgi:hypothetical protein
MEVVGGIQSRTYYYALEKWSRGIILKRDYNPDGPDLPHDAHTGIMLDPSAPLITRDCWTAMQRLFIHCIERDPRKETGTVDANNEVCVVFAAHIESGQVVVAAMPQVVGRAHVTMDRTRGACNLVTGEYYKSWPPPGYCEIGDCHSHNRMRAFFSGVDDNDDRGLPGVHMVCGEYQRDKTDRWEYRIASSVVADQRRYENILRIKDDGSMEVVRMSFRDLVVDTEFDDAIELHPDVLNHVHVSYPEDWKKDEPKSIIVHRPSIDGYGGTGRGYGTYRRYHDTFQPFGYGVTPDAPRYTLRDEDMQLPTAEEIAQMIEEDLKRKHDPSYHPNQLTLFEEIANDVGIGKSDQVWWLPYLKDEIDNIYETIDCIREMCPTEEMTRKIIAAALNKTHMFKTIKIKGTKGK